MTARRTDLFATKTIRPCVSASAPHETSVNLEITDCDLKLGHVLTRLPLAHGEPIGQSERGEVGAQRPRRNSCP